MPVKLSPTLTKIDIIENMENRHLVKQYNKYMNSTGASERHQNNNLKVIISFVNFLEKSSALSNQSFLANLFFQFHDKIIPW